MTDCEDGIRSAIKESLGKFNVPLIRCCGHLFKSIKAWLKAHKGHADVGFYCSAVRENMLQENKENFEIVLNDKKKHWHRSFIEYFDRNILPDYESIAKCAVKDVVGEYFNDVTGISTNHKKTNLGSNLSIRRCLLTLMS